MAEQITYVSTRGKGGSMKFSETVLKGQADDGGLIVPYNLPTFSQRELETMVGFPFHHVAFLVLQKLAPDIPHSDLWQMVRTVFKPSVFKNTSDGDEACDIVPVRNIGTNRYLVRLSNGPTLAFKDHGLQMLGCLFEYLLNGGALNILGATSGDTGAAAIYAMLKKLGINVFMLSPLFGMSTLQSGHMRSVDDPHIFNIAIKGSFDDCQTGVVKKVFDDLVFKEKYHLGAINSINWARIGAQVIYYVWAYLQVQGGSGNEVDFAVPTGNFGDIYAGYIARKMVIPIRKLVLATNANDVLHEFRTTGVYQPRAVTITTTSPSMDIQSASNFERYIYHLFGDDPERVSTLWGELKETGKIDLTKEMPKIQASGIASERVSEAQCHATICHIYNSQNIIIDPHTAVAMHAALVHQNNDGVPMLVLETAQPCKFDETIVKVLGKPAPRPPEFEGIEHRPQKFVTMNPDPEAIKAYIADTVG